MPPYSGIANFVAHFEDKPAEEEKPDGTSLFGVLSLEDAVVARRHPRTMNGWVPMDNPGPMERMVRLGLVVRILRAWFLEDCGKE